MYFIKYVFYFQFYQGYPSGLKKFLKIFIFFLHMETSAGIIFFVAGYGSVWLERTAGGREVAGSNPVTPIFYA